jgi:hypothetical protein
VQLAAAARVVPQVVADLRKDVALVPVMVSDVSVTVPVPVFLMVTSCAAVVEPNVVDAKVSAAGDSETVKVEAAVPVPLTATVFVPAPVATLRVAERVPAVVGWKDKVTVQEAPAASILPRGQVVEAAKELAPVPEKVTVETVRAVVPPFFKVMRPVVALVVSTMVAGNA